MILIKNRLKSPKIDPVYLKKTIQKILGLLDYSDFSIGILLTTDATIQRYNRDFRHKDKPTDILSFPYHPKLKAGKRIKIRTPEDKNLGDIIISIPYVMRDAQSRQIDFQTWFERILVHGICHLLGYDHISDKDYAKMLLQEQHILCSIDNTIQL